MSPQAFTNRLSRECSLKDFVYDLSRELVAYADTLDRRYVYAVFSIDAEPATPIQFTIDSDHLPTIPKRYRINIFNTQSGKPVRFSILNHFPYPITTMSHCAICSTTRLNKSTSLHQSRYAAVFVQSRYAFLYETDFERTA